MLTALEQHFLVHHVGVLTAAHWLDGDHHSMMGGAGPGRAYWMTDSKGVNYTMPGEERPDYREVHKLTWAAIRDHVAHQPASLVTELHDALAASSAEARRYWDAMTAINKSWYSDATDEQRAALNAERERSRSAERIIGARVRAVVLALLPLHDAWPDEEPTDLIEWAEALAP